MIINRTPFRISFFGGGTDYPSWYLKHGGSVLSSSIDKYCYITCRTLPPFFEHKLRVVYSKVELCNHFEEVRHPVIREVIRFLKINDGLEIHYDGDLPARSGMGSSSSFTVGLLHALYAHLGIMPSKSKLASEGIYIEQEMMRETVGSQDQVCTAYGGLNQINFLTSSKIEVCPLTLSSTRIKEFNSHLMLFYTGISRTASELAKGYTVEMDRKIELFRKTQRMVEEGIEILQRHNDICKFGELLHEAWVVKRQLCPEASNPYVDELYKRARDAGAIGGKITGAGGGGFLLLFVPPSAQNVVREALAEKIYVPFSFEFCGSQIIFYEPERESYRESEKDRAGRTIESFAELDSIKKMIPIPIQEISTLAKNPADVERVT
jgi:D-glycero-alpha-D-manno-heptose-7-phosphate kinase